MNGNKKTRTGRLAAAGVGLFLIAVLGGCSQWNDNPGSSPTLTINPAQLAAEMGLRAGSGNLMALSQPVLSDAQSEVQTLIVGAVVIRSRTAEQGPYTDSTPISDVGDALTDDLANSSDNLTFFHFDDPAGIPDVVEIQVPPPGAEQWQILAAGLSSHPNGILDMLETANQDAINYVGFDGRFLETAADGAITNIATSEVVDTVDVSMRRACLVTVPPLGCAQFKADGNIVLTDAVEVLDVTVVMAADSSERSLNPKLNDTGVVYPIMVRGDAPSECYPSLTLPYVCTALGAASFFNGILVWNGMYAPGQTPLNSTDEEVRSITTHVTRQKADGVSDGCATATTVDALRANCDVELVTTVFE